MNAAPDARWRHAAVTASPDATGALAARLARGLRRGDAVALWGDLGAGKTTFARGVIAALAAEDGLPPPEVPSPTFTLVQTYEFRRIAVWHFDLYRVTRPDDVIELGFDEALAEGAALIEWPERLGALLPGARIDVTLAFAGAPDARRIELTATPDRAARFQAAFA